jgi:hypothetical protein
MQARFTLTLEQLKSHALCGFWSNARQATQTINQLLY